MNQECKLNDYFLSDEINFNFLKRRSQVNVLHSLRSLEDSLVSKLDLL